MAGHIRYFVRLCLSLRAQRPAETRHHRLVALALTALVAATVYGAVPAVAAHRGGADLDRLADRARGVQRVLGSAERVYRSQVAPLERVLLAYSGDERLVRRIAVSLLREARATGLEPRLLLAVLLVENPWLDPRIRSPVGAVGLMQVMPFHEGEWDPCAPDLEAVEANICHGAQIFAAYLAQTGGDLDRALLRYNGCVNGTNTPDCHLYPSHIYARAGRASLMAWRRSAAGPAMP
jgi:soluble lytic murein transglycosylase-like protein